MAEIFRAESRGTGTQDFVKEVAIKRILPTIAEDEEFIDMFIDNIDFDICDEDLEREFENGCPTAARYRKKDGEFSV